jgi:UDP-glucuronate decarboxylase
VLRMLDQPPDQPGPVNLGNPEETSVKAIAELIIEMTGSASKLSFCDLPQDDPKRRQPDITRARNLLGFEPATALREGLARTIAYFAG